MDGARHGGFEEARLGDFGVPRVAPVFSWRCGDELC